MANQIAIYCTKHPKTQIQDLLIKKILLECFLKMLLKTQIKRRHLEIIWTLIAPLPDKVHLEN